jgi:hypothetical protein
MTAQKESHRNRHRVSSPEGCWKLAGDNIPGHRAILISRPGGAPENLRLFKVLKVIKGIIPKFTLDLGCPSIIGKWRCHPARSVKVCKLSQGLHDRNQIESHKPKQGKTKLNKTKQAFLEKKIFFPAPCARRKWASPYRKL